MMRCLIMAFVLCGVAGAGEIIPFVSGNNDFDPVPLGKSTVAPDFWNLGGGQAIVIEGRPGSGYWKQDGWGVSFSNIMPRFLTSPGALTLHWMDGYVMAGGGVMDWPLLQINTISPKLWNKVKITAQYDGTPVFMLVNSSNCVDLPPRFGSNSCGAPLNNGWTETFEVTPFRGLHPAYSFSMYALTLPGGDFVIKDIEFEFVE